MKAEEFLRKKKYPSYTNDGGLGLNYVHESMIEFAKYHVQKALEVASKKEPIREDGKKVYYNPYDLKSKILKSYSLENIK